MTVHALLAHQLRHCFGSADNLPAELAPLVQLVDASYRKADDDRRVFDRRVFETPSDKVSHELNDHNLAIREALAMVEGTIESTTDGLLVVDRDGRIVRMNSKFGELWRIPDAILAARDEAKALAFVLDQLEEPQEFLRKVEEVYANPDAESFDTLRFKDRRIFERYSMPLRVNGVTTGRVWSFRDVTHRLQLEEQLRQSQKMEAIGLLAGGVAHDFNNLLTVISGHAELLLDDTVSSVQREDVTEIRQAAKRAARLTQQLLAFGRKQMLRPVVLDLSEVVGDVRPMLERLIGEDIQMELVATKNPALVMADRGQIEQVLVNLVVNARAAMPNGGRIVLRIANIELKDEARSRARGGAPGSYVLFSISDTGVGIAPEAIGRVFEPFFTTKEAGKGTGLGLATVYGIVRQSGGFIEVASDARPGGGTTFEIFIPAVVTGGGVPHIAETILPLPTPSRGTETVLVVEDEAALRKLLRRTLEKQRYTVMVAQSGRDALAQILDHKGVVDLVVTDVVMPQMGGPEFVQHLRISHPDVPVLYLSGYTDDEIVRRGVVQSETKLLGKPFTTEQLLTAVRELLDAASPVGGGGR